MNKLFALALLALPVHAQEIQFDLAGPSTAGPVDVSFALDMSSGATSITDASSVQQTVTQGAAFSNVSMTVNGQSVVAAPSLTGAYSFSTNSSAQGPFLGYGSLSIWIDPQSFFFWQNIPTNSEPPGDQFNSAGLQITPAYLFQSDVMVDRWYVTSASVTVIDPPASVPEPSTLVLLSLGLAVVVGLRNFRRR